MHVPYGPKGMRVMLCPEGKGCEAVGELRGSYDERDDLKGECRRIAFAEASRRSIESSDWGYACCTVTAESDCRTKFR